jgi:AcrR family transcriptional regulator
MANGAATSPRRSGLVQTRSRDTRRKLIEAARELWNEGSFEQALEATTVADIARAAGMSKGTFYFHFASKQEILLEMAWATTRKMVEEADAGIRRGTPMFELADQLMRSMARRISRTPKALVFRVIGERSRLSPDVVARRAGVSVGFEAVIRYG